MITVVIGLVAAMMGAMGVAAIAAPEKFLAVVGSQVLGRDGRNEVRAVYGGMGLAMAAGLLYAISADSYRPGILLFMAVLFFGMAAGRVVSAVFDKGVSGKMMGLAAVEALGGVLLVWAG